MFFFSSDETSTLWAGPFQNKSAKYFLLSLAVLLNQSNTGTLLILPTAIPLPRCLQMRTLKVICTYSNTILTYS